MADRTPGGRATGDERARIIQRKTILHQIHALEVTIEQYDIHVLEAEQNIARTRETIQACHEQIELKRENLAQLEE